MEVSFEFSHSVSRVCALSHQVHSDASFKHSSYILFSYVGVQILWKWAQERKASQPTNWKYDATKSSNYQPAAKESTITGINSIAK